MGVAVLASKPTKARHPLFFCCKTRINYILRSDKISMNYIQVRSNKTRMDYILRSSFENPRHTRCTLALKIKPLCNHCNLCPNPQVAFENPFRTRSSIWKLYILAWNQNYQSQIGMLSLKMHLQGKKSAIKS